MSLEKWSWVASIIGGIIALIGLPFVAIQLASARRQQRDAIRLSQAQVLFAADSVIAAYKDVAAKLRPGGEWTEELSHVHPTNAELHLVERISGSSNVYSLLIAKVRLRRTPSMIFLDTG